MQLPGLSSPRLLFLTGMAVYALTAWRSEGYHHPDEHFQILEFANYRLGRSPADDLPWEFAAQIRPGLQPMLAYGMIRIAETAGIDNPFAQAFLLRLLSGWLCLWLFFQWAKYLDSRDPRLGNWLRLAVVFLWFVPYLSVRFSSENWAGMAFGGGLLLLSAASSARIKNSGYSPGRNGGDPAGRADSAIRLQLAAAGFLLGLSFFFRFQMGFALAGLGAWWVWNTRKQPVLGVGRLWLLTGSVLAAALGIWADVWLYGERVFTAYRYFEANIVQNIAANWGTSPWWYYPVQALLTAVPPVSIVLLALLGVGVWQERKSALVWCLVPFLLAHTAVGHKEIRFLYPMLLPVLVLAVQGFGVWKSGGNVPARVIRPARIIWLLALGLNFLLLPVRCLLAAQEAVPCFRFLYDYAAAEPGPVTIFSREKSLYEIVGLPVHFYRSPNVQNRVVGAFGTDSLLADSAPTRLIFSPKLTLPDSLPGLQTERIYTYLPEWILQFNPNDWQSRSRIWSVYRYAPTTGLE